MAVGWLSALVLSAATAGGATPAAHRCAETVTWPHWQRFVERFVEPDGRVHDGSRARTTAEGQAQALFFALVTNDRLLFERILRWTDLHLAEGALGQRLPGWMWGCRTCRGRDPPRLLSPTPSTAADVWLAYVLLEASRLWASPELEVLGRAVLDLVAREEVVALAGLGPVLLPARTGFEVEPGRAWRLSVAAAPPFVLRRFAGSGHPGPWASVLRNTVRLVEESSTGGLVPDWVVFDRVRGVRDDPVSGGLAGEDAVRTALWAGLLADDDPLRGRLDRATDGALKWWLERGSLPERIEVRTRQPRGGPAPPGHLAALLPAIHRRGDRELALRIEARLARSLHDGLYGETPSREDQELILFVQGFLGGQFRLARDGKLSTRWSQACAPASPAR